MVNRFRKVFANPNTEYTPDIQQSFIPDLSGVEALMDNIQTQFDATSKYDLPKYLRESATDKEAFANYKTEIEGYRQSMIDSFKEGDISSGQSSLRDFGEYIRKSKMPDGTFFELERGVSEYGAALKELKDTYLDPKSKLYNPYIFKYGKDKLDKSIPDFKDEFGNVRTGISGPTLNRYIPDEEVTKQLDVVLDNIQADQVIRGSRVPKQLQGLSFKQILERGETEFIDFNKVANVLAGSVSPEMIQSYNMLGKAMGLGEGQGGFISPEGNFDTNTMFGRKLQSLANSKVFKKDKDNASIITDNAGLEQFKSRLRKSESDYEFTLGNETLRTQVFTNNTGMPELNFKVDKDGIVIKQEISAFDLADLQNSPSGLLDPGKIKTTKIGNIKNYLNTPEGRDANPAFTEIYDQFRYAVNNMEPKKAYEFLEDKYKEKKDALSVVDAKVNIYGPKVQEAMQKTLIGYGPGSGLGNINKKRIVVLGNNGKEPKAYTLPGFLEEYGITTEDFKKNSMVHGSISSDNNIVISGEEVTWSNPKTGETIDFIASEKSIEELNYNTPDFTLFGPAHKGDIKESGYTNTNIPELDQTYGRIQSRANDIYDRDIYAEIAASPRSSQKEKEEAIKNLEEIDKNPRLNKFRRREVELYDETGINLTESQGLTLESIIDLKRKLLEEYRNGMNLKGPSTYNISSEYTIRQ